MAYNRNPAWKDWPNKATPITSVELENIEEGIVGAAAQADAAVAGLTNKTAVDTTLLSLARTPDALIAGAVTRDANGAATSAPLLWPDGQVGTYTALVTSATFAGAVDSYQVTYGSPVTKTFTQPTITRDASGAAVTVPAISVS